MRSESCWAPPSKRRSGPRSSAARNGVNGSPHRIQNSADNKDGGVLLRANTPSIALPSAAPPLARHAPPATRVAWLRPILRPAGPHGREQTHCPGTRIATQHLFEAYAADCKKRGVRAVNYQEFGRACTQVFGLVQKCNAESNHDEWGYPKGPVRRPHGYDVPTAEVWQERLDARLGIPGKNLQNRNKSEK